jgi:hypothetical protein
VSFGDERHAVELRARFGARALRSIGARRTPTCLQRAQPRAGEGSFCARLLRTQMAMLASDTAREQLAIASPSPA